MRYNGVLDYYDLKNEQERTIKKIQLFVATTFTISNQL